MLQSNMTVQRLMFFEMGSYHALALRPYQTHTDAQSIGIFNDVTNGGTNLSTNAVAQGCDGLVRPSAQAAGMANIAGGWDERRFVFLMHVSFEKMGVTIYQVLSGYTDRFDLSLNGTLSPDMMLHFNNSVEIRQSAILGANGRQMQMSVRDASHILTDSVGGVNQNGYPGGWGAGTQSLNYSCSMRPMDIFHRSGVPSVLHESSYTNNAVDGRVSFLQGPKKSRRSNSSAPVYLSRLLTAQQTAERNSLDAMDDDQTIHNAAAGQVIEQSMMDDGFISTLDNHSQIMSTAAISYGELCSFNPHVDGITQVIKRKAGAPMRHGRDSNHWNGANNETLIATILSHSVPALMLDLMLLGVEFTATNSTIDSDYAVAVTGANSFAEGIDLQPYVTRFIDRLKFEILSDISRRNRISFGIHMRCDVAADTTIDITLDGNTERFTMPSFCDALATPVFTTQRTDLDNVANDIMSISNNLEATAAMHYDHGQSPIVTPFDNQGV